MFRRSLLSFSVLLLLTFVLAVGSGFAAPTQPGHSGAHFDDACTTPSPTTASSHSNGMSRAVDTAPTATFTVTPNPTATLIPTATATKACPTATLSPSPTATPVRTPSSGTQKSRPTVTIPPNPASPLDTFSALALLFALLATALYITSRGGYGPRPPLAGR